MAILRTSEIRKMNDADLEEKLRDLQLQLAKERGKIAVGGFPENSGRVREVRRTIARIKTIQNERSGEA